MADQQTPEDAFRNELSNVITILEKLIPICGNPDDMVEMLQFALKNDAQLAMLMHQITPLSKR